MLYDLANFQQLLKLSTFFRSLSLLNIKDRRSFEDANFSMYTCLILSKVRLIDNFKRKRTFSIILSISLYLLSHIDISRLIFFMSFHDYICLLSKQFIERYIRISKKLSFCCILRPLLLPNQHLKISIMQLRSQYLCL